MLYTLTTIKETRDRIAEWVKKVYSKPRTEIQERGICIVCKKDTQIDTENICLSCFVYLSDFQLFLVSRKNK